MAGQTSHMICGQNKYSSTCTVINTNIPLRTGHSTRTFLYTKFSTKMLLLDCLMNMHITCVRIYTTDSLTFIHTATCMYKYLSVKKFKSNQTVSYNILSIAKVVPQVSKNSMYVSKNSMYVSKNSMSV